jgi:hypothetical protein
LSNDALFVIILFIGIIIGTLIMSVVGYGLWVLDYVCIYDVDCPAAQNVEILSPPQDPNLDSLELNVPTETATPFPPDSHDLGATATAACGTFESQFPGTPCPDTSNP